MKNFLSHISFLKNASKGLDYAIDAFATERKSYRRKQQWRGFLAPLFHPTTAKKWFKKLEATPYPFIIQYRKRLYFKPFRVYMSTRWNNDKKIKVIDDTYRYIFQKEKFIKPFFTEKKGLELTKIQLNETTEGILYLGYNERYRKEGELVLQFDCEQLGGTIAAASFAFEEIENQQWICRIACIQGHPVNLENASKTIQKMMFGLRPKAFLVFVIQELSRQLGFAGVYGAGDDIQAFHKKNLITLPWKKSVHFDYNAIFSETSGELQNDGWYKLPLIPVRKVIKELKTSKRATYTRRYVFLDSLSLKIGEFIEKIS